MCTYLETVEATYYFRRMVPAELRPFILTASGKPRTEFKISLRTKDRDTAKRLLPDYVKDTDAVFDEARLMLAKQTAQEAAGELASAHVEANLADARAATQRLAEAQQKRRAEREPFRQEIRALLNFSTAELHPRDAAIRELMVAGGERMMASESPALEPRRGDALPLLDMFDGYAAEAQIRATTAKDWRKVLGKLIDFLGYDDASRITQKDLRAWRDALLRLPNEKGQLRSPKTVSDTYLAAVRATLQWGVEQGQLPANAATGVKVRIPKAVKLREREFTNDEAKRILAASLVPASDKMAEENRLARRWIPWLCAYTGARVNEISQLRAEDVAKVDGYWTLRITPEAGTTKDNEARLVPLHEHLIAQGFLNLIQRRKSGPMFYNPGRQRVEDEANRLYKRTGENLAAWVRDTVGITDKAVQPNHAWRHLFKTNMVRAGVERQVADAIQGHKPRSVGETYGSVPLETKAAAIDKLPRFAVA